MQQLPACHASTTSNTRVPFPSSLLTALKARRLVPGHDFWFELTVEQREEAEAAAAPALSALQSTCVGIMEALVAAGFRVNVFRGALAGLIGCWEFVRVGRLDLGALSCCRCHSLRCCVRPQPGRTFLHSAPPCGAETCGVEADGIWRIHRVEGLQLEDLDLLDVGGHNRLGVACGRGER